MIWICKKATGGCGYAAPSTRFEANSGKETVISCPMCKQDHAELLNVMDFDDQTQGLTADQMKHAKSLLHIKLFPETPQRRNTWFSGR